MALLSAFLIVVAQPIPAALLAGAYMQPAGRFILCPGDRRCPRGGIPSPPSSGGPDFSARPAYGSMSLSSGFAPDPRVVNVTAGGTVAVSGIDPACGGFVARVPDVRIAYTAGSLPLTVRVRGQGVSLLINAPDGRWYCTPVGEAGVSYRFAEPRSGQFDIWVGSASAEERPSAQLLLSEVDGQEPEQR